MCVFVRVCVCGVCVCVCVCVNYSLMLHDVQTRDKFSCMILAWTINNLILEQGPEILCKSNKHGS